MEAQAIMMMIQGVQKMQASNQEAARIQEQGAIARKESIKTQRQLKETNRRFVQKQSLAYLKNGVSLSGSPMLILEESTQIGIEEERAIGRQRRAKFNLVLEKSSRLQAKGEQDFLKTAVEQFGGTKKSPDTEASDKEVAAKSARGEKLAQAKEQGKPLTSEQETELEGFFLERERRLQSEPTDDFWSRTGTA